MISSVLGGLLHFPLLRRDTLPLTTTFLRGSISLLQFTTFRCKWYHIFYSNGGEYLLLQRGGYIVNTITLLR